MAEQVQKNRYRKPIFIIALLILALILAAAWFSYSKDLSRDISFRAEGAGFQIFQNGQWQDFFVKGVNMGAGKPGTFPGEMAITKEEYRRWFQQIADMNANTIRVYTILAPDFYQALFEHNIYSDQPLYLFHGVWLNEEIIAETANAYDSELLLETEREIKNLIDVLHGNNLIEPKAGHASGFYFADVSPYVAGYILGIELDANFVINTNEENAEITSFEGDYLYTENAPAHESWLAWLGDMTIAYEQNKYGVQKPISWVNWLTTDPFYHSNEPSPEKEDAVSVDTELIQTKESFTAGLFASYHIYPYYPEFMVYQPEYASFVDDSGRANPYRAYLRELRSYHSVPVLVAEFGVPSSRGCTHVNEVTDYNQGYLTETEQGEMIVAMMDDIVAEGYAGGLVFTWQDEWFKRSWNTMDLNLAERRPFWPNYQVSEQFYGLLTFDPGPLETVVLIDGKPEEWRNIAPICQSDGLRLSVTNDEMFLYLLIEDQNTAMEQTQYVISLDSVAGQGNESWTESGLHFKTNPEFIISLYGQENASIKVDAYYDVWYRQYSRILDILPRNMLFEQKNTGVFNPINLILSKSLFLPLTETYIPQRSYETGVLRHGCSDPESPDFDSLADYFISQENNCIEIRIPWQILNVIDPSEKMVMGDLYQTEEFQLIPQKIEDFQLELHALKDGAFSSTEPASYTWEPWEEVTYHERLKKSYDILKGSFAKL